MQKLGLTSGDAGQGATIGAIGLRSKVTKVWGSTCRPGEPACLRWRSMTAGAAQMTCWPFWYWMRLRCCSVLMMSSVLIMVAKLSSLMEMLPSCSFSTCMHVRQASQPRLPNLHRCQLPVLSLPLGLVRVLGGMPCDFTT